MAESRRGGEKGKKHKSRNTATGGHINTISRRGRKGKETCEKSERVSKEFSKFTPTKLTVKKNQTSR